MKSRLIAFWVLLTAVFFLHTNALPSQPQSKGQRLIGHGITEGAIEFGQAFALARDAGLEFIELPLAWDNHRTSILHMKFMWLHDVSDSKLKEFDIGEFSIDEKTRRDGHLEPGEIVNLILAEPPAVPDQTKGTRTIWVSNLVFE